MNAGVSVITTVLFLLAAAIGGGAVSLRLKLPSMLGYIAGGVVVGALCYPILHHEFVDMVAQSGITLLLFAVGIEFSFHSLKRILSAIALPSIAQIGLVFLLTFALLLLTAMGFIPAVYLAISAALSSTAIVVKLLSERGELETTPGEVATGWLIVQDLAVVPILILLSVLSVASQQSVSVLASVGTVVLAIGKSGVILALVLYLGRIGVPRLLSAVAAMKNKELLLLTTIGIVFLVSLTTYAVGLSLALGAFLAGLLVSETSQNHAVFAEVRPLRDLFAVIFFVSLGLSLRIDMVGSVWQTILLLSLFVIVVKGSIIFFLLRFLGYHRKTAFLVGVSLTQVSEFGFVLAQSGLSAGVLTSSHATILVAVTFITIITSSLAITQSHRLYYAFDRLMRRFPKLFRQNETGPVMKDEGYPISDHVVILGYGRVGKYIGRALLMANVPFLVVDYNQSVLRSLQSSGIKTVYGDPGDKEVLDYAQVDLAKAIVVAIPDRHTQELVIANAVSLNRNIHIICRTHHEEDQRHLKSLGVHLVIQPEFEAALTIVGRLLTRFGVSDEEISGNMHRLKIEHGIG